MTRGPRVTDHALVRWLARSGAMDVEPLRAMLAASLERAAAAAGRLDAGDYLILADGLTFVVKDGVVVTVLEDDGRHAQGRAMRRDRRPGRGRR
jgi:hypothetical protein